MSPLEEIRTLRLSMHMDASSIVTIPCARLSKPWAPSGPAQSGPLVRLQQRAGGTPWALWDPAHGDFAVPVGRVLTAPSHEPPRQPSKQVAASQTPRRVGHLGAHRPPPPSPAASRLPCHTPDTPRSRSPSGHSRSGRTVLSCGTDVAGWVPLQCTTSDTRSTSQPAPRAGTARRGVRS